MYNTCVTHVAPGVGVEHPHHQPQHVGAAAGDGGGQGGLQAPFTMSSHDNAEVSMMSPPRQVEHEDGAGAVADDDPLRGHGHALHRDTCHHTAVTCHVSRVTLIL